MGSLKNHLNLPIATVHEQNMKTNAYDTSAPRSGGMYTWLPTAEGKVAGHVLELCKFSLCKHKCRHNIIYIYIYRCIWYIERENMDEYQCMSLYLFLLKYINCILLSQQRSSSPFTNGPTTSGVTGSTRSCSGRVTFLVPLKNKKRFVMRFMMHVSILWRYQIRYRFISDHITYLICLSLKMDKNGRFSKLPKSRCKNDPASLPASTVSLLATVVDTATVVVAERASVVTTVVDSAVDSRVVVVGVVASGPMAEILETSI